MLGIDLYQRYNLVSDWAAVRASGVRDVYVKLSDGAGKAAVPGDVYVARARAAGMQVGGYHYMQPTPTPEAQADVFAAELRRLRALDLAPALDLEENSIPAVSRVDYGRRFLRHLQGTLNISRVAVYSSASWFAALHPDAWGVNGLVDWVAQYGVNDGREHAITAYLGHVDVHQYTSAGHIPGIAGLVDVDTILTDITEQAPAPTPVAPVTAEVDDMALITGDWPEGQNQRHHLICPVGSASTTVAAATFSVGSGWASMAGHIWFIGAGPNYLHDEDFTAAVDVRKAWTVPDGTDQISVQFNSENAVGWCLETKPK